MARLLTAKNLFFLHMPRTGGTWIEKAITLSGFRSMRWLQKKQPKWICLKHALLAHANKFERLHINNIFSVVRHPIPYYESTWKWIKGGGCVEKRWSWHPTAVPWQEFCRSDDLTFNDWVFLMLEHHPLWYTRLVEQYMGPAGGEFVDYIGRTETVCDDFLDVVRLYGYEVDEKLEQQIRGMGKQNAKDLSIEWSADLKARVLSSERLMIDRFYGPETIGRRHYAQLAAENASDLAAGPEQQHET